MFRNAAVKVKSHPGADCDSDHVPVVGNFRIKLKKLKMSKKKNNLELSALKKDRTRTKYRELVQQKNGKCK